MDMFKYKIDVLKALKEKGYNQTVMRKEGTLSQATITRLRNGEMIGINVLEKICAHPYFQPGDIIEFIKE